MSRGLLMRRRELTIRRDDGVSDEFDNFTMCQMGMDLGFTSTARIDRR